MILPARRHNQQIESAQTRVELTLLADPHGDAQLVELMIEKVRCALDALKMPESNPTRHGPRRVIE